MTQQISELIKRKGKGIDRGTETDIPKETALLDELVKIEKKL